MTIKEMEKLLEMPRANIRFYEQEGLITPERKENGYRDYSDEDARTLERVRLLRALGCPVSEIREIKEGRRALSDALRERQGAFADEMEKAGQAMEICEAICISGVKFDDLDAGKYMSGDWKRTEPARPIEPPKETPPKPSLWRRFWARMLDVEIYTGLWTAALCFLWPSSQLSDAFIWDLLAVAAGDIVMLALEPVFLRFFGATIGKWILGLRVCADDGGRLTIRQARARTAGVLWHGMCLGLPVAEWRVWWKRYQEAGAGEPMRWEDESYIEQRGGCRLRAAGYIGMRIAIATALVCCMGLGRMPVHRGELTPEQFAENYNRLIWAYGQEARGIDAQGNWLDLPEQENMVVIVLGSSEELSGIDLDVQDGIVQGLKLTMRAEAGAEGTMAFLPTGQMQRAAIALCTAESPKWREMWLPGSGEMKILRFFEQLEATGRGGTAEQTDGGDLLQPGESAQTQACGAGLSGADPAVRTHMDGLGVGGWVIEYTSRCSGGVYAVTGGDAVILPDGEGGIFEMEFTVRRK